MRMRLLIIHNFYQDPGGEDMVFRQESSLLDDGEHQVRKLEFQNHKGVRGLFQFIAYPWNFIATRRVKRVIKDFKPDLVHIHNLHYALGPLAIRSIHRLGIPLVFTLHNYRLLCPSATLYHQGEIFTQSLKEQFPWTAVKNGVWSRSILKTFWLAFTWHLHGRLGTWNQVDRYFVLTEFAKELFQMYRPGIDPEKWIVKPNFTESGKTAEQEKGKPIVVGGENSAPYLFVGRLSREKGVGTLINSFIQLKKPLRIAGDGPLRAELEEKAKNFPQIEFLGALDPQQVHREMEQCQALIFPSEWYEGMPMTLVEAFSCGTAVIASRLGAMEAMIQHEENGVLFPVGEPGLIRAILHWEQWDDHKKHSIRTNAHQTFLKLYSVEVNKKRMLEQYQELIDLHQDYKNQENT